MDALRRDEDLNQFISRLEGIIRQMSVIEAWNSFFIYVSHDIKLGTLIRLKLRLEKMGWIQEREKSSNGHPFTEYSFRKGSRTLLPSEANKLAEVLASGKVPAGLIATKY